MKKSINSAIILGFVLVASGLTYAQETQTAYKFTTIVKQASTPVKNQAITGTCWSFATTSFFESELLRMGKGEYDLSEMFTVRFNYINRINDNYLKQGRGNLTEGSLSHMLLNVVNEYGMVPEDIYNGINYNSKTHNHKELNSFINAIAAIPIASKMKSPEYEKLLNSLLDIYLGPIPEKFNYKGKIYIPKTFFQSLNINLDDYEEFTSFTDHPYYSRYVLDIPDNWDSGSYNNIPLEDLIKIMNFALNNGYTVCWDGDMSEKNYSDKAGIAVNATKEELTQEKGDILSFGKIYKEDDVTPESRQKGFESFATTDDHLMHIIGLAKDQNGVIYYIAKNSWKPESNQFGGYNYLSEKYVRAKTIAIMVHKKSIPKEIIEKARL